ncbi:MAG: LPS-assembly protein LptD [Bacteroidales bacterium]|nr:LPS-assembly protein LptD [Bacteroidales bacterium]
MEIKADTTVDKLFPDTVLISDTIQHDTTGMVPKTKSKKQTLESQVRYSSRDSMITAVVKRKLYLYGEAQVYYEDIELKADFMEFDMNNSEVTAMSLTDTSGSVTGKPVFKKGDETFESDTIRYNFKTKKGLIKNIVTEQGEGYLHSHITKRLSNGHIHIKNGKYTTCNAEHPHFYIGLTKAIAIPDDKIVSGPAYFVMEDIPLPLILPFGFFPNSKRRSAGILFPSYGEERTRGFFLKQGGLYIPFSDYMDLVLQADVYLRGTIGIIAKSSYNWKYHFSGGFDFKYYWNRIKDDFDYRPYNDYSIVWRHTQSPKANPTRTFSANVNISKATYSKNYSYDLENYLRNNQSSSILYSKRWGSMFALNVTATHTQDNISGNVNLNLPNASFKVNRFYPFRSKNMSGKPRWFENIQLSYDAGIQNKIATTDSTILKDLTLKNMQNGFYHNIPVSMANIRLLNFISITPSLSYKGVAYTSHIEKSFPDSILFTNSPESYVQTDTIYGLRYAHAINSSISISANPKIYGMFQSTRPNSYIRAVRHVISPSAGFSFSPDVSSLMPNYYHTIRYPRSMGRVSEKTYSMFEGYLYGTPVARGSVGAISLSLNNNLEMKVLSKNDTTGEPKKVSILDNLNFSSSYNPFVDTLRWNDISMNGATRLLNNRINVTFGGSFSPYALDEAGNKYNRSHFKETRKLVRLTRFNINIGTAFQSGQGKKSETTGETSDKEQTQTTDYDDESEVFGDYVDFDIPWSLRINYSWSYNKPRNTKTISHTIDLSGDLSLTKKWKIGGRTGYDLVNKEVTITNISISRDLHCWTMQMSAVPFGPRKSYVFTINAKSAMLRDLKWDKRKSWWDNL